MLWLLVLALGVFVLVQNRTIRRLERRLNEVLNWILAQDAAARGPSPTAAEPQTGWVATPGPPAAAPPAERMEMSSVPAEAPVALEAERPGVSAPTPVPTPQPLPPAPIYVPDPAPSVSPQPAGVSGASVSNWLAENGLAWIGGGGLALGGLLLVTYAAQQGVFTPPFRIAAAVVLGAIMIAASEWILRQKRAPGGRHLLAAAVAAGAGAVTLYGAVCAAYALYDMLPFAAAAILGAAISLGLFGLSLRHGEPLALLAVVGAVATPAVTGLDAWSPLALNAYGILIGLTGFGISALRGWDRAGYATLFGLLLLSLAPHPGSAILLMLAVAASCGAVIWRRIRHQDETTAPKVQSFRRLPAAALILASLTSIPFWLAHVDIMGQVPQASVVSGLLIVAAGFMILTRLAAPGLFAVPVAVAVFACVATLTVQLHNPRLGAVLPWIHGLTALIPIVALSVALRMQAMARTELVMTGSLGVAVLAGLTWFLCDSAGAHLNGLPPALLALGLFASAAVIARRVETPAADRGLGLWIGAAAGLAFMALHSTIPTATAPLAFAVAALTLGLGSGRLSWQGLAQASTVGGLATLATLLRSDFIGDALEGRLSPILALGVPLAASGLLYLAARLIPAPSAPRRHEAEAVGATALAVLLTGLFIGLHILSAGAAERDGSGILFEGSLRTLILLAGGLMLTLRQAPEDGPIARWRTQIVILAGLAHGVVLQILFWNPWWGMGAAPAGPPVLNTLILSFLAPAALLAACAWKRRPMDGWSRTWITGAVMFAFAWAVLTVRHLFHGTDMGGGMIGRAEACAYAIVLILTAGLFAERRLNDLKNGSTGLNRLAAPFAWVATGCAVLIFGLLASPWWGPFKTPLASFAAAALLFGLYGLGALALTGLRRFGGRLGVAAAFCAVGVLFALLSLLIRFGFHGLKMAEVTPGGGLETWSFSALWAVFGLAALYLGGARKEVVLRWAGLTVLMLTAAKVLVFDLARLEGVIRAASFLAVGALFIAGALMARRLNIKGSEPRPPAED